eukprot:augustus_masked-scaffold_24-processed-gene-2.17-mRNA-1 protein AED:1.00 eAED:1.00 QI:0/0/0/0/1/1/2/0/99
MNPANLPPRWRCEDYPLCEVALRELGRIKSSETKGIEFKVKVADLERKAVPKVVKLSTPASLLNASCLRKKQNTQTRDGGKIPQEASEESPHYPGCKLE